MMLTEIPMIEYGQIITGFINESEKSEAKRNERLVFYFYHFIAAANLFL